MAGATTTQSEVQTAGGQQKTIALVFGSVFALVGILGPILGGANGDLIVFGRNYLHDAIHLASGLAGLAAGAYAGGKFAGDYLKAFGAIYLVVTVAGFALMGVFAELIGLNMADNVLHLVLAVALLGAGFGLE
ncbi:DUF4383 domain-containing protein [Natronomonas marina]|jgi:hypothetical protein|uniref:DUF4383 domain-containing protein n=1 Tax=Natronomonas marina TaxID=2961939 RepID=UPI0020CA104F|nr:DUF4383 domain-containing protein [Natronomonas marina]